MIPKFPEFKKVEWADRKEFESHTRWMAPHSDFNFVSVWAWTINEIQGLSILNDNLVIKYSDYLPGTFILSFAGKNRINETAAELIKYSKKNHGKPYLTCVPEEVAKEIKDPGLVIRVNESHCDYVLSVSDFSESDKLTIKQGSVGNNCRRFMKLYPEFELKICRINDADKDELRGVFYKWAENKKKNISDLIEFQAFERYITLKDENVKVISIYVDGTLVGFQTFEILSKDYAMCDFMKCDVNYKGIYQMLMWKICEYLEKEGISYLNLQVDLGNPRLKKSKNLYNPKIFLKRYIVEQM
jgi:hypothetical protein